MIRNEYLPPAQTIFGLYDDPAHFDTALLAHVLGGYVYCSPLCFLLARPVPHTEIPEAIENPWTNWKLEECDTWLVYAACGDLGQFFDVAPFDLDFIAYQRNYGEEGTEEVRFHSFAEAKRKSKIICPTSSSALISVPATSSSTGNTSQLPSA